MDNNVPNKVIREIIADIVAGRGNSVVNNYYKLNDIKNGIDEETAKKIGIDSKVNNMLAERIQDGAVPMKEIIDLILTPDEIKLCRTRCDQWLENQKQDEIYQ